MCSGSEAGSHLRRIDFVYHSTLGVRVIQKTNKGVHVGGLLAKMVRPDLQTGHTIAKKMGEP